MQKYIGALNFREQIRSSITPCGSFVFAGSEDNFAYAWNTDTGRVFYPNKNLMRLDSLGSFYGKSVYVKRKKKKKIWKYLLLRSNLLFIQYTCNYEPARFHPGSLNHLFDLSYFHVIPYNHHSKMCLMYYRGPGAHVLRVKLPEPSNRCTLSPQRSHGGLL